MFSDIFPQGKDTTDWRRGVSTDQQLQYFILPEDLFIGVEELTQTKLGAGVCQLDFPLIISKLERTVWL